jgi:cytochrome P450
MTEGATTFDPWVPFRPERADADLTAIRALQATCPVNRQVDGNWLVTSAEGVRGVLERIDDFGGTFGDYTNIDPDDIILPGIAEPLHAVIRRGVNASVAYHRSVTVKPYLIDLVTELVGEAFAECDTHGEVDLYRVALLPVPAAVIAHLLGVPVEDRALFTRWGDELCERQLEGENFHRPVGELHPEFAAYLDNHIAARKSEGATGDDSISRMMRTATQDGLPMSDRMIRTQLMNLLVAGNETTRNLLGSMFYLLATNAELVDRLNADRLLIPNFVEETLRLEPPVRFLVRRCSHESWLAGTPIDGGDTLLVSIEGANRDGAATEKPDELDLHRSSPRNHLAFGAGPHICPGAFLARLEAEVVLDTFFDLVDSIALADGAEYVPHPIYWARGPVSLTVTLSRRKADATRP